ncbi:6-phosphogluconolactonase [Pararhodobacter sp.]|uniref:6-phosphogluconolactonase n=1 Tax=Pararhodobacter sp. TaxID=2127056 RepID=UPI002AFDE44F|nr:6-phosphogluconolactonase [Pararhodobacter sp.]
MNFIDYADTDMMMLQVARLVSRDLRNALERRDRVLFSVPGGSTPGPIFDLLAASDLEWERVDIIPGDERWVSEDHPRSNSAQIRSRLLRGKAAAARLIPLWRDQPTPQDAIADLIADIEPLLPIDVAIVGMGADMHTASLFPGADMLERALAEDAPVAVPITAPGAAEPRITLSARVLRDAYAVHVLITGDEKNVAIHKAAKMKPIDAPIAALLGDASVHWAP